MALGNDHHLSPADRSVQRAADRRDAGEQLHRPPPGNTHGGNWGMRAITTATPIWNNAWQFANVAPSSSYVAGCWLKGTGAVELRILAGQWNGVIANQTFTAPSSWRFLFLNVNTGSNTQLTFNLTDSSGVADLLANPGFESGATGWRLNGTPFTILQNP
jgi:hypothetical protein